MIRPATFLSRALLADAVFSGVAAVALTLGAGALAPFLNLPEILLRETGLFLIAYTALVGWLASRSTVAKALVLLVIVGNAARIRVSSVTIPLASSGTLKSTRKNTRLPLRFRSVIDSFDIRSVIRETRERDSLFVIRYL